MDTNVQGGILTTVSTTFVAGGVLVFNNYLKTSSFNDLLISVGLMIGGVVVAVVKEVLNAKGIPIGGNKG